MNQYSVDTRLINGHLELNNIPFSDNTEVKVFIVPKIKLSELSFAKIRNLTKKIKGNISENIDKERDTR